MKSIIQSIRELTYREAAAYSALLVVLLSACTKDILNTTPQTSISQSAAFSTPDKILAEIYNLYSKLQGAAFYGGRYVLFNEQRGEEFSQNDPNSNVGASIWGQNALSTDNLVNNLWSRAYAAINASNIFISEVSATTVIKSPLREQYVGEAKFVRALSYLALVQTFAQPYAKDQGASSGVPLRLLPETSLGDNDLARSTVAQVYAQILKDLNEAEAALPDSWGTSVLNSTRAHKASAIALKARVYLVEGDFASVVSEAKKLVPQAPPYQYVSGTVTHKLETSIASVFSGIYTGPEAIFTIPFNAVDAPDVQSSLAASYYGAVVLSLNPAGILSNQAFSSPNSTDARKSLTATKNGQRVLTKFVKIAPYTDFVPVIRYAEVLLNYAEAAAETSDPATAVALLQAVRNRADPSFVFNPVDLNSKTALVETILTERRIELLGEGFRTPDLQRRLQTLPSKTGAAGTAPAVAPTDRNYIWPIPSDELSTNKLITPNP